MHLKFVLLVLTVALSGCSQPSEEDRQELIGLWQPEDGTTRTVEFKQDGEFDYRYFATLRLGWKLASKGKVYLLQQDGSVARTCYYEIEGNLLRIDNGSGETCVAPGVTPPEPMPLTFRRSS